MTLAIRTLTRCIWVMVKEDNSAKDVVEKASAINLLLAFSYATKNYLREEYSYDEEVDSF
jgi:putative membrane protein